MTARRLATVACLLLGGCTRDAPPSETASAPSSAGAPPSAGAPLSGIGIRPLIAPEGFAVGQVFPGGPAARGGLRVGDVVTAVDGESSARWTLEHVAERLRGAPRSRVTLAIERDGVAMTVTLTRDLLRDIPAVPR